MNTLGHRWIITTTALFWACLTQSASGETPTISLSIEPTSPTFVEGEPIQIVMNFKNDGNKTEGVDLGSDGKENLKVIVEDEHSQKQYAEGKGKAGFSWSGCFNIKPKSIQSHRLILDDLIAIRKAGRYQLTIQIKNTPIVSNKAEFQILPSDSKSTDILREKYELLWKTANAEGWDRDQNQQYALRIICLTRHEVAIEYQKKFVFKKKVYTTLFDPAVTSLISTRDPVIIRLLVDNFLDKKGVDRNQQRHLLYRLRLAGANEWDAKRYKELIPYREKIKNAARISVSD